MWLVESKPIKLNVTMPITSFSRVLRHRKFVAIGVNKCVFAQMTSCSARYDVIYHDPFAINCQYLKSGGRLTALIFAIRRRIHQEDFTTRTWSLNLATSATCWENLRSRDKLLPFPEYNIGQKSPAKGGKMKHFPFYHIPYPDFSVVRLNVALRKVLRPGQKSCSDRKNSSRAEI